MYGMYFTVSDMNTCISNSEGKYNQKIAKKSHVMMRSNEERAIDN